MKRIVYLPPVRMKAFKHNLYELARAQEIKREQNKLKAFRIQSFNNLRKEIKEMHAFREILKSPNKPQIDLNQLFDPAPKPTMTCVSFYKTESSQDISKSQTNLTEPLNGSSKFEDFQKSRNSFIQPISATDKSAVTPGTESDIMQILPRNRLDSDNSSKPPSVFRRLSKLKLKAPPSPNNKLKSPIKQIQYAKLFDKIMTVYYKTLGRKQDIAYSEELQNGLIPIDFEKIETDKLHIMFKSRRLEMPKHAKEKFSKTTNIKFMKANVGKKY